MISNQSLLNGLLCSPKLKFDWKKTVKAVEHKYGDNR